MKLVKYLVYNTAKDNTHYYLKPYIDVFVQAHCEAYLYDLNLIGVYRMIIYRVDNFERI